MTYTTSHPISVDGVRLDTLAWGIEAATYSTGGLRTGDVELPGVDGVLPSMYDAREPGMLSLSMFVKGTDEDGLVPYGDSVQMLRRNLDALLRLFGQTARLLDVREVINADAPDGDGTRQALAKVQDAIAPTLEPGQVARFTVNLAIPSAYWRSVEPVEWRRGGTAHGPLDSGAAYTIVDLDGTTAPITDAILVLTGPAVNPRITDLASGQYVELQGTLTAGEAWRINVSTWETRTGQLTLDSDDGDGFSAAGRTEAMGETPYLLPLRADRPAPGAMGLIVPGSTILGVGQPPMGTVRLAVSASGLTLDSSLTVRARKTYL